MFFSTILRDVLIFPNSAKFVLRYFCNFPAEYVLLLDSKHLIDDMFLFQDVFDPLAVEDLPLEIEVVVREILVLHQPGKTN